MPDQKKNLSTSSFKKDFIHIVKMCSIFFLPVVIVYGILEYSVVQIPTSYKLIGEYLDNNAEDIEVLFLGSSQVKNSVNPKFIDKNSINLSSTSQHHNTDFEILKQTRDRLPKLKTIILEVSYGHFELHHNSKYFWKNNLFLKFYDVNIFERSTYYKDKLIYLSRPGYFSSLFMDYYINDNYVEKCNIYGFDEKNFEGKFQKLNYQDSVILKSKVKIERRAYPQLFGRNVAYFRDILDYCKKEGFNIIICSPPTHENYNVNRNPEILKRRDSILKELSIEYKDILFMNSEQDKSFTTEKFRNENHLNPDGAEFYSKKMNELINSID